MIPLGEPLRPGGAQPLSWRRGEPSRPGPQELHVLGFSPLQCRRPVRCDRHHAVGEPLGQCGHDPGLAAHRPPRAAHRPARDPGTSSAYQFLDQPFKLGFSIENSPSLYRAETTTRLDLDARTARDTSIEVQRVRGALFEIQVAVPAGLELLSVGPPELVESAIPTGTERPPGATGRARRSRS